MKHNRNEKEKIGIVIDSGHDFDQEGLCSFIRNEIKKRMKEEKEIEFQKNKSELICLASDNRINKTILKLNGIKYNEQKLYITEYNFDKYPGISKNLKLYFKNHYNDGDEDLQSLSSSFSEINLNYFRDFQYVMYLLGAESRKHQIEIKSINLSSNNIKKTDYFSVISVFLPDLTSIKLNGNGIPVEELSSSFMSSYNVEFNGKTYNENFEDQSTDEDDVQVIPPATAHLSYPEIDMFMEYYLLAAAKKIESIGDLYADDAQFAFYFPKVPSGSPLFSLFENNYNYALKSRAPIRGKKAIIEILKSLFPNNFLPAINNNSVNLVDGIFYSVTISGTTSICSTEVCFIRTIIIVGIDGQLKISNDTFGIFQ